MKSFTHSLELIKDFPDHFTGIIPFFPITTIKNQLTAKANDIQQKNASDSIFLNSATKSSEKWQSVFLKMGAKPKYESSITSVVKRFKEYGSLWSINPVVDFYNSISLAEGIPMAAYDRDKIGDFIELRYAKLGELFTPLGNPKQSEKTKSGEVIYSDELRVVCRYWNLNDCDQCKISESTKTIVLFFDLLAENATNAKQQMNEIMSKYFDPIVPRVEYHITGDETEHIGKG